MKYILEGQNLPFLMHDLARGKLITNKPGIIGWMSDNLEMKTQGFVWVQTLPVNNLAVQVLNVMPKS